MNWRDTREQGNEALKQCWMGENGIAQGSVRQIRDHCDLYAPHDFSPANTEYRESENAIAFRVDQRLHESAGF